jgi:eukaryotic-like serine/threonine-protein kinase
MSTDFPTVLEGKYELIGKIAEGGMGAIYKARHILLNEVRVIKVMRPHAAEKEEHRRRFLREAQTATKLRHPNIVTFYDFAVDESDTAYMVMEFIDGVTFNQLIRGGGALTPPVAVALSRQCLSALAYLHHRSIVHRDVSPDNILLAKDVETGGQVKLIDLGIAKAAQEESLTVGMGFIGKLRYCSPEQLSMTEALDGRSDLFSFGIVFSEMLTGVCPLPGDSAQSILMAHVSGKFLPFEHTDPQGHVPPSLRRIVEKALKIERSERIQSAEEFIALLEEAERREGFRVAPADLLAFTDRAIATRPAAPLKPPSAAGATPLDLKALPATARLPKSPVSPTPGKPADKTELWAPKSPASAPPPRPSKGAWTGVVALVAVLAAAVLAWALLRDRGVHPAVSSSAGATAPPTPSVPTLVATAAPTLVAAVAAPTEPPLPEPTPAPATRPPRPTRAPVVATAPVVVARAPAPTPRLHRERSRFCSTPESTSYAQARASEQPNRFDTEGAEVFRGPRPDAARIRIVLDANPPQPLEGEPFRVTARLVNGGDLALTIAKVEESAPAARGGFQPVGGVSVPVSVQVGGSLTIYSSQIALSEGDAYAKEIRITDRNGDTWRAAVRVGTCPD